MTLLLELTLDLVLDLVVAAGLGATHQPEADDHGPGPGTDTADEQRDECSWAVTEVMTASRIMLTMMPMAMPMIRWTCSIMGRASKHAFAPEGHDIHSSQHGTVQLTS